MFKKSVSILTVLLILLLAGCGGLLPAETQIGGRARPVVTDVRAHIIDVGQGDAIFIETPEACMLIDAGTSDKAGVVKDYITELGYDDIDIVVATHPHSDHIGGMEGIIKSFDIGTFYMPKVSHNTKTFEGMLKAVEEKGMSIHTAKKGVNLLTGDGLSADILSPVAVSYKDLNDYSAVIKLTYGDVSFLFMGDAETAAENLISDDVSADVLKVGHHGSTTSSGLEFLVKVSPSYAVISCGKDNSYGHPHEKTMENLNSIGAEVFVTSEDGTVVFITDGQGIEVETDGQ